MYENDDPRLRMSNRRWAWGLLILLLLVLAGIGGAIVGFAVAFAALGISVLFWLCVWVAVNEIVKNTPGKTHE